MPHAITQVKRKERGVRGQVQELAGELIAKTRQLKLLEDERNNLVAQHTILVSLCDSLHYLRQNRLRQLAAQSSTQEGAQHGQQQVSSHRQQIDQAVVASIDELLLLQQLAGIEYSGPHCRGATLPCLDLSANAYAAGEHQPISPDEDPLLLMRYISAHPLHPTAAKWQLPELMQHCSVTIPQLAMALAKLEAGLAAADVETGLSADDEPSQSGVECGDEATEGSDVNGNGSAPTAGWQKKTGLRENLIQTIQKIQVEWLQILGTLMDECKAMLVLQLSATNFDTGETETEPSKRRHMFAVRSLGLTPQQLRRFKEGFTLFARLQGYLAEQQQQQQQRGTIQVATQTPTPEAATAESASAALQPPLAAAAGFNTSTGARLEAQQAAAAALNKVLQKQRLIAGVQMFFLIGTLSWQQYAKLRVLMSPFTQFAPMLQACIMEYAAEMEQKQQLQQQVREKKKPGRKPAQQLVLGETSGSGMGDGLGQGVFATNGSGIASNTQAGQFELA